MVVFYFGPWVDVPLVDNYLVRLPVFHFTTCIVHTIDYLRYLFIPSITIDAQYRLFVSISG